MVGSDLLVDRLVVFYGMSTFVGYLMPNTALYMICRFVGNSFKRTRANLFAHS